MPNKSAARRKSDAGVTLVATLVILIVYAGFASLLQAKAMARSNVAIALSKRHEEAIILTSARAFYLPDIAESLLSAREGKVGVFGLEGEENAKVYAETAIILAFNSTSQNHIWEIEFSISR